MYFHVCWHVLYALSSFTASLFLPSFTLLVLATQIGIFDGTHPGMIEDRVKYHHTKFGAYHKVNNHMIYPPQ